MVLGHRPPLRGAELEPETRTRVERGIALHLAGRAKWLLFSGGPTTPGVVEADVMARYAEQHGVPSAAILRERASHDTIENARLSIALLRKKLELARAPRVVLVTSDYHSQRAMRLFRCAGAEVQAAPAELALSPRERRKRLRRERWVAAYYALIDECTSAKGAR